MKYTIATTLFAAVCLGSPVNILAGIKPAGETCNAPMQCVEPLYCLKASVTRHACERKRCGGQGECRIGQYCGKDGYCTVPDCKGDGDCKGETVCQVNKKCGSKSSGGQACDRGKQCWSEYCKNNKCTHNNAPPPPAPSSKPKPKPVKPAPTPTPMADDGLGEEDGQGIAESIVDEGDPTSEEDEDEEQGIVGDTVDAVGDAAGGAVDAVDDTVSKSFRLGGGGIAGIVIGCLLILALCCGLAFCLRKLRNRSEN